MGLMRSALLMASQNSWLREKAPRYKFIRRSVERFLPGESLDDALAAARRLADARIGTLLTHLGENVTDPAEAEAVTNHYLEVLGRIRTAGLPSEISVKLTQLGLDREVVAAPDLAPDDLRPKLRRDALGHLLRGRAGASHRSRHDLTIPLSTST